MTKAEAGAFAGFPVEALDFYDDLEVDNTRSFWEAHKDVYATAVKAPFEALSAALAPEFGAAKIFRPYRDVRFAKDKTPYKTHQGAFVQAGPGMGFYVELSPRGVRVGGGWYHAERDQLAALRDAMADDKTGRLLRATLTKLEKAGFEIGGDRLKTTPRGYDADHPRIELLRHKSVVASKSYGFEKVIHTADVLDLVREDWRAAKPLVTWGQRAVAGVPEDPRTGRR